MKKIFIVPHSHWDREWYMPFESHRMRLVELIDNIIELMEADNDYCYYHLDGQTIAVEDYLEIRPQNRERLMKLIRENKIQIGPWYVLQDEFLIDGESNIRNLMTGIGYCRANGVEPLMCGYLPDAFGNISQMPQILNGFGIDNAVFGRGIGRILCDNMPDKDNGAEVTEYIWSSPDGSSVIGIKFLGWYNNGAELPEDAVSLKKRLQNIIAYSDRVCKTPLVLLMNGSDHQPLQKNLSDVIKTAGKLFPDITAVQSGLKEYIAAIREYSEAFIHVSGEMISQNTVGYRNLINTASTHIPLKQRNHTVQNLLITKSEPINVMSWLAGDVMRRDELAYAWKTLMKNHPHDSICTCSCDEVAGEMAVRFNKSQQVSEYIAAEAAKYITDRISLAHEKNICVFHGYPYSEAVAVTAELHYNGEKDISALAVYDINGHRIPAEFKYLGKQFRYTLPKDSFRKSGRPHIYTVRFLCRLSGIGYTSFYIDETDEQEQPLITVNNNGAENEFISFTLNPDGTFNVTEKQSGHTFERMNRYEDLGDKGDSYNFEAVAGDRPVYCNKNADISIDSRSTFEITYKIVSRMDIPEHLDGEKRSAETAAHDITTYVTLSAHSRVLKIHTELENKSENHRLRAVFPCGIESTTDIADGQFDVLNRPVIPCSIWENPENPQRCRAFFGIKDGVKGALVATRGLHEYEVMRHSENALALTLLRAVGEMGDWGDFPTPDMQLKRKLCLDYSFIPFAAEELSAAYSAAYDFYYGEPAALQYGAHTGNLPASKALVDISGEYIGFSCFKPSEDGSGVILRLYNTSDCEQDWTVSADNEFAGAALVDLAEKTELDKIGGKIKAAPKKIYTVKLSS
ncbi:MAG TPA: hypothetical protein DCY23_02505 [Ruminococcaceae bacterium]|nr:hypothetical protein [Oscillospiraceae bacterium]